MADSLNDWETVTPDSDWENINVPNQPVNSPESFGDKAVNFVKTANEFSPMNLMVKNVPNAITSIFNKAGEKTSEYLGAKQVNPNVSGAIGTGVAVIPDIASSIAMPNFEEVTQEAVPLARRALGFNKSLLKTPFARGKSTKAAETALEQGVIGTSPQGMYDRASELATKAGQPIGNALKKTSVNAQQAFSDLDKTVSRITKGAGSEGTYKGLYDAVDNIKNDLAGFASQAKDTSFRFTGVKKTTEPSVINADTMVSLKSRLGKSLNYLADLTSQIDNKEIVNTLANTVRKSVKAVLSPEEFADFVKNQKLYSSAELMKKGLNNEIASQMGNSAVSLPGVIAGGSRLAAGDLPGAVAATGLFEGAKRGGAGLASNIINSAGKQAPRIGYSAARIGQEINNPKSSPQPIIRGNIDLNHRPIVNNPDGSYSTVRTITVDIDGKTVLLPTVINGKIVSPKEAVEHYKKTGEHMGVFENQKSADDYDKKLHEENGWNGPKNKWSEP